MGPVAEKIVVSPEMCVVFSNVSAPHHQVQDRMISQQVPVEIEAS